MDAATALTRLGERRAFKFFDAFGFSSEPWRGKWPQLRGATGCGFILRIAPVGDYKQTMMMLPARYGGPL